VPRQKYSFFRLALEAIRGHADWQRAWRQCEPKRNYDAIVIGGGAHGLATAYYLASVHGLTNVALLERSWIGSGNAGRNTTIIRSNYLLPENIDFYELSLQLWEGLESELNYNAMVSQRGVINTYHSDAQRDAYIRRGNAMRLRGVDAELIGPQQLRQWCPLIDFENARFPVEGGLLQGRGGTVRHDAVVWGYARGADALGVDIIQDCEVTGFLLSDKRIEGVRTTRGEIRAPKVGVAVAGSSSRVAAFAGLRLPIETHVLQAFVTEAVKPLLDTVISFGAEHMYMSQSDKGGLVFGGDLDGYNSYAQRGNLPTVEHVCESALALMPCLARLRVLRSWGGVMDMSMDGSPVIDATGIEGLYINTGWCYGGFKASPASGWCFAHLLATGDSERRAHGYRMDRFATGRLLDEKAQGPHPNRH
jgi:methylglutamate dehydrogenase subunit A